MGGGGAGRPLGVAVIGCGGIAHSHFAGWQRLVRAGEARLAVACDNELARAQAPAERSGAAWGPPISRRSCSGPT